MLLRALSEWAERKVFIRAGTYEEEEESSIRPVRTQR